MFIRQYVVVEQVRGVFLKNVLIFRGGKTRSYSGGGSSLPFVWHVRGGAESKGATRVENCSSTLVNPPIQLRCRYRCSQRNVLFVRFRYRLLLCTIPFRDFVRILNLSRARTIHIIYGYFIIIIFIILIDFGVCVCKSRNYSCNSQQRKNMTGILIKHRWHMRISPTSNFLRNAIIFK